MTRLLLLLPLLGACVTEKDCSLIGCLSLLNITVTGAGDAIGLSGSVTLDGQTFVVDCDGGTDPAVLCDGTDIQISLGSAEGGGEVAWSLSTADTDTGTGGGYFVGEGTFTPAWSSTAPNGEDCGPICWTAEASVELSGTP